MSSIDLHNDEIGIKIVYYGPGLGGKTSSLQYMHGVLKPENRGRMISLATGIDRTLYFDFLPIQLPKIKNFSIRMSVYTVPGQVHYNATRKLVLQGADGVVFVADSQPARQDANIESMENLRDNLQNHGMDPDSVPMIIQYNKCDLKNIMSVEQMNQELNFRQVPFFQTSATRGDGVYESLKAITKLVLADLKKKGIYKDESTSIAPQALVDATGPHVTISHSTVPPAQGSTPGSIEFPTSTQPPQPFNAESSGTLEAAIAYHAHQRQSSPPPPSAPEDFIKFSNLWTRGYEEVIEIERAIKNGEFKPAVDRIEQTLSEHLKESGDVHASVAEALLSLGTCSGHYLRYSSIVAKAKSGDIALADALFCLFFLTDVELRMQAAGLKQ